MSRVLFALGLCLSASQLWGCKQSTPAVDLSKAAPIHLDKGVGPVKAITLAPLRSSLAAKGKRLFGRYCSSCHALHRPSVGPPLGKVAKERTPEWILNMILNPLGMVTKNPNARKLLQTWSVMMPMLGLSTNQARAVLEYLRETAAAGASSSRPVRAVPQKRGTVGSSGKK